MCPASRASSSKEPVWEKQERKQEGCQEQNCKELLECQCANFLFVPEPKALYFDLTYEAVQSVDFGGAQIGSFPRWREARGGRGDLFLLELRASSLFVTTFICSGRLSSGYGPWPPCSFPAVWYVVAAVLRMQFLVFPDAVNIFPVSLQSFARLCSQALRAGGFPHRESIPDAGCTCSKAREGRPRPASPAKGPRGLRRVPGSPAEPCARFQPAQVLCLGFGQFAMV